MSDAEQAMRALMRANEEQRLQIVALLAALEGVASWCEAYPAKVFPKDAADAAITACKQMDIPIDAMHGTWARHLLEGIGRDCRAAIAAAKGDAQ